MDDLPVEEGGAPGGRGEEPHQEECLEFIVERKPEAKEQICYLLCQGDHGKYYPVGHPVHIFLGMDIDEWNSFSTAFFIILIKMFMIFLSYFFNL